MAFAELQGNAGLPFITLCIKKALLPKQIRITRRADCNNRLVLEVFADCDAVTQTLSPSRLEHQIPRQSLSSSWLQRSELDTRIGRISRYSTPVIKCHLTERLTGGRCSQIRFESVRIKHWDEGFDGV
jgi:hypothetical protein